jgi:hypothetical protein
MQGAFLYFTVKAHDIGIIRIGRGEGNVGVIAEFIHFSWCGGNRRDTLQNLRFMS